MDKPLITILVGPPGSGKSTWADDYLANHENVNDVVYVNQDTQGKQGHLDIFTQAIKDKKEIVVDRMNFSKGQRARYLDPARKAKYRSEIIVFHVPRETCVERASARTDHPTIKDPETAAEVVYFFFKNYGRPKDTEADQVVRLGWDNQDKRRVVICDLDGTLANCDHRLHYVRVEKPDKPNWKKFFEEMPLDPVNEWCSDLLHAMSERHQIIYCTGRAGEYYDLSKQWLEENNLIFPGFTLFSRMRGDHRADWQVKEIIYEFEIKPRYDVLFVVDDRTQVVEMWRKHGVTVLQCAPGNF